MPKSLLPSTVRYRTYTRWAVARIGAAVKRTESGRAPWNVAGHGTPRPEGVEVCDNVSSVPGHIVSKP